MNTSSVNANNELNSFNDFFGPDNFLNECTLILLQAESVVFVANGNHFFSINSEKLISSRHQSARTRERCRLLCRRVWGQRSIFDVTVVNDVSFTPVNAAPPLLIESRLIINSADDSQVKMILAQ